MKILSLTSIVTATIMGFLNLPISNLSVNAQTPNFFCGKIGATPATIANKKGNNIPIILWSANNYFSQSGEDTLTRCTRVSGILSTQERNGYRNITVGTSKNGEPNICAAIGGSCRLLYQVPGGQNPQKARQELLRRVANPQPNLPPITID
ncbi:COP23 domain-containing protein [Okeania sp.]|uniref:COP23 domain-containing protein n=1 Tax=Okeania sp. TaxID=3100323 RepID=UPI002B4B8C55|nr:COP23 domain-containing protein [Okeania sp.]MEB3339749.1 COP23 domain-containing protein [Okeania sp.]